MYTFIDIINVDTFHYETHVMKKIITTANYKKGRRNLHKCFLRISVLTIKSTFCCTLWGWGEGGQEKHTFYTLVKMLIIMNSPSTMSAHYLKHGSLP